MEFKYVIRAIGDVLNLGHGVTVEIPFSKIRALIYPGWQTLQAEILATGFEFDRQKMNVTGKEVVTFYAVELKLLGNILRWDSEQMFSVLNGFKYVKMLADELKEEAEGDVYKP